MAGGKGNGNGNGDGGERPVLRVGGPAEAGSTVGGSGSDVVLHDGGAESSAGRRDLTHAGDARGLTKQMRRFLALRLLNGSDAETAKAVGVNPGSVTRWKAESAEFRAAYDDLWEHGLERFAEQERRRLIGKALLVADELMDAASPVRTKEGLAVDAAGNPIMVADHLARAKGSELTLRANGMYNPPPAVAGDPTAMAAIAALHDLAREAQRRREGAAPAAAPAGRVIDGDARPVD